MDYRFVCTERCSGIFGETNCEKTRHFTKKGVATLCTPWMEKILVPNFLSVADMQSCSCKVQLRSFFPPPPPKWNSILFCRHDLHTLFIPFEKLLLGFCPLSFRCYSINHDWNIMYTPRKENNSRITMHTRLTSYLLKRKKDEEKWEITNASTINI